MIQKPQSKTTALKPFNLFKWIPWKEIGLVFIAILLSILIIGAGLFFVLKSYSTIF